MNNKIIETFNLSKIYHLKDRNFIQALDDVNIKINEGEKFGLLGPNGAGKTTMISILSTLIQPSSGYAIIDGENILKNPYRVKSKIALMLGNDMIYYRITGYANLKFFCKIYGVKDYKIKIKQVAQEFEIENWLNEYVERYSSGMKCKLSLCRVLLTDPKILFLDEPTLGLDVKTTKFIIDKLKNLNKTIFLTSHNMDVVDKLCSKIAFINNGKIIKSGSKEELRKLLQKQINVFVRIDDNKNALKEELERQDFITQISNEETGLKIELLERTYYKKLFSILEKYEITKIQEMELSIEDLFLKLVVEGH
ncbi:MAG: ATP-binding cassette domain-containing protein [Promethearchaeota archaeon]